MRTASKCLSVLTLALIPGSFAHGATVTGTVKAPDGAPFRGAFVQAQNTITKITVSVLSDKNGRYRIENLPAGAYQLHVKAVGYRAETRAPVTLTAVENATSEFPLQKDMVRWSDLSSYQGVRLFPSAQGNQVLRGKEILGNRCFACHGFETRMASVKRDKDAWIDRVNYMRGTMHFFLDSAQPFSDQDADDVASYINLLFGENSVLPPSPAEMPAYKSLVRSFGDDAMKIVYVEYELPGPNRMPWSAVPDKDGNFWMPYYGTANRIGKLDPKTGAVQGSGRQRLADRAGSEQAWKVESRHQNDRGIPGQLYSRQRRSHVRRAEAYRARRSAGTRMVHRHAADGVRPQDGKVHAHPRGAQGVWARAR